MRPNHQDSEPINSEGQTTNEDGMYTALFQFENKRASSDTLWSNPWEKQQDLDPCGHLDTQFQQYR